MFKRINSKSLSIVLTISFFMIGSLFFLYTQMISAYNLFEEFRCISNLPHLLSIPSTETIRKNFYAHRNEFDKLKSMLLVDKLLQLDDTGLLHRTPENSKFIPNDRKEEYLQLMKVCRVKSVGYSHKYSKALLGFWDHRYSRSKGYFYFYKFNSDVLKEYESGPTKCVPLESNWFIYEFNKDI